jgi:hypothetical protein
MLKEMALKPTITGTHYSQIRGGFVPEMTGTQKKQVRNQLGKKKS